jgi:hypothetical protein
LAFRGWGLGMRVSAWHLDRPMESIGFRVAGFGFRVAGFGFRVSDLGFRA